MAIGGRGVSGQAGAAHGMPEWLDYLSNPQKLAGEIAKHERAKADAEEALAKLAQGRDIERLYADAKLRADTAKAELEDARKSIEADRQAFEAWEQVRREDIAKDRAEFEKEAKGERAVLKAERKAATVAKEHAEELEARASDLFKKAEDEANKASHDKEWWIRKRDRLLEAMSDD